MISEFVIGLAALIVFSLAGFGLWALGKWLRTKGHGHKLDQISTKIEKLKATLQRYLISPLCNTVATSISKAPLFGKHYKNIFRNKKDD